MIFTIKSLGIHEHKLYTSNADIMFQWAKNSFVPLHRLHPIIMMTINQCPELLYALQKSSMEQRRDCTKWKNRDNKVPLYSQTP